MITENNFYYYYIILLFKLICLVNVYGFNEYQDADVLYKLNFPGKVDDIVPKSKKIYEDYPITTAINEKYICKIPVDKIQDKDSKEPYVGPNPIELLSPLFDQEYCSFKLESYWTYEICHGRYVRQFHEDREGKKIKLQEYFLGVFNKTQIKKLSMEYDERKNTLDDTFKLPTKSFDGTNMPYVEMQMVNGTICDLSNKPRSIKLFYICQHDKHDIHSIEEVSSCEYQAIILSPLICRHPDYDPRESDEEEINCLPANSNTPRRPKAFAAMESESLKLRHQKSLGEKPQMIAIFHVDKDTQDGEPRVRVEFHPADILEKNGDDIISSVTDINSVQPDVSPVQGFLSGKNCLHGGIGWWKYEFCYGKSIVQYHAEKNGQKVTIDLGKFDKLKHLEWIEANPHKRPKPLDQRKHISHFYGDGNFCDKVGKMRQTEVKLKCLDGSKASPSSVSLTLSEPKTCEYHLSVESPLICNILKYADENGLINNSAINFDSSKTETLAENKEEESFVEKLKKIADEL